VAHAKAARSGRKLKPLAGREHKPRQKRLPQMDDPAIEELEALAEDYADVRDKRIALNKTEVDLQGRLLVVMKTRGKEKYHHGGITCTLVHEKEKVKVKIAKEKE
jgi:hypothetical protein